MRGTPTRRPTRSEYGACPRASDSPSAASPPPMTTRSTSVVRASSRTAAATPVRNRSRTSIARGIARVGGVEQLASGQRGRRRPHAARSPSPRRPSRGSRAGRSRTAPPRGRRGCGRSLRRRRARRAAAGRRARCPPRARCRGSGRPSSASCRPSRWCAPRAAAFTSFSTRTSTPSRSARRGPRSSPRGRGSRRGRRDPLSLSTAPGMPMPIDENTDVPAPAISAIRATVRTAVSMTASAPKPVGMRTCSLSSPSAPIATAAVFVPPMSMPSLTARPVRLPSPRGRRRGDHLRHRRRERSLDEVDDGLPDEADAPNVATSA